MTNNDEDMRLGHRKRLREKCDKKGYEALTDQELFELILFAMLPRIDTKPIVKTCFAKFKSFSGIIKTPDAQLLAINGLGRESVRHIKAIATLLDRISFERIQGKNILSNWQDLQFYCVQKLSHYPIEAFLMVLLSNQNKVITVEELGQGTVNQMTIYPREVLKLALAHEAVGVIFVHNHPSQDTRASREDILLTKKLQETLRSANITLHDHLIVAGGQCVSLRNEGLFDA